MSKKYKTILLGEIVAEDTPEKVLTGVKKKWSPKSNKEKLLGIRAAISYDAIQTNGF